MTGVLESRIEAYRKAWESGQIEHIASYWADNGAVLNDFITHNLGMNKAEATKIIGGMLALVSDLSMKTISLIGNADNAVWETESDFICVEDFPDSPYRKGDRGKLLGATIIEWNQEGKMVKHNEYCAWGKN